jgi:transposase
MRGRPLVIEWQDEATKLREEYRREKDPEIHPRLQALWLLRAGHPLRQTAELVGVHYVTVQTWVAWYRRGGLAEVRRHKNGGRQGRRPFLGAAQREQLAQQAALGTFRTARDVQDWLVQTCGVHYTRGGLYSLLARLGWKPKVSRPQAINASAPAQEEWKKGGSRPPFARKA